MELSIRQSPVWLDPSHPNYERWKRSREISVERGEFVKSIIEKNLICKELSILDVGSGEGGTAKILSDKNFVVSFDLNMHRLQSQKDYAEYINLINGNALFLPFKEGSFDLIILQDVIEHVTNNEKLLENVYKALKPEGIIYLSTPNRFSFFNIISDPHWGFPIVCLMKREKIKKYFLKFFRKSEQFREDAAQLLSLKEIIRLFSKKFEFKLYTRHSVQSLLNGNKGIVWSKFHLTLIKIVNKFYLKKILLKFANDEYKIINNFFSPTFYFILKKKN